MLGRGLAVQQPPGRLVLVADLPRCGQQEQGRQRGADPGGVGDQQLAAADVPGATGFDPGEPIIVLVYATGLGLLLTRRRHRQAGVPR